MSENGEASSRSPSRESDLPGGHSPGSVVKSEPHSRSLSRSKSRTSYRSRSRSRSHNRSHRRRRRSYSRSRSRSHHRYSRSRSRSPHRSSHRSSRHGRYDRGDRGYSNRFRSRSRSPMSSRRRHQGNRDDPEPTRCLGVFGLSLHTQERDLRDVFARYGSLEECNVVYDRQSGRSRGFAFVYYRNIDDAIEAKDRCSGMEIDGRRIRVDYSITTRAHTPTPGIYLGKPTTGGYERRRSPSPNYNYRRSRYSRSRSRSYSPRRY